MKPGESLALWLICLDDNTTTLEFSASNGGAYIDPSESSGGYSSEEFSQSMSSGAIVGIAIGTIVGAPFFLCFIVYLVFHFQINGCCKCCKKN
jgi:hypothetical protein